MTNAVCSALVSSEPLETNREPGIGIRQTFAGSGTADCDCRLRACFGSVKGVYRYG